MFSDDLCDRANKWTHKQLLLMENLQVAPKIRLGVLIIPPMDPSNENKSNSTLTSYYTNSLLE